MQEKHAEKEFMCELQMARSTEEFVFIVARGEEKEEINK